MQGDLEVHKQLLKIVQDPQFRTHTSDRIVELLRQVHLKKLQRIMRVKTKFNVVQFLRVFRDLLKPRESQELFVTYGILKLFQEMSLFWGCEEVTFPQISALITEKMPIVDQQILVQEKMYPSGVEIPISIKKYLVPPEIIGKVDAEKQRLYEKPYLADKFNHLNRRVAQVEYSAKNQTFMTIDFPSLEITFLNSQLQVERTIKTELDISKRDAFVTTIAWSEHQQRIACILGNYSISVWSLEDNFRFQVNVPLPSNLIYNPYVMIRYSETNKRWYTLDNRPTVYFLNGSNFEPEHTFSHGKMVKHKETEKMLVTELKYKKLLCVAFERNLFLISFETNEMVASLSTFKTAVTSICFSEAYQALFVSNFQNYFTCFEFSEYDDLSEKGRFEGHKHPICLLGTLQNRPIVYSLEENAILKLWDIRDFNCYQSFSVLKNILYEQLLTLTDSICLVGSKIYLYKWAPESHPFSEEQILLFDLIDKDILLVTTKSVKLFSHFNGQLIKAIKGAFQAHDIYHAFLLRNKNLLYLASEEGEVVLYDSRDFCLEAKIQLRVRPFYFSFEPIYNLLTVCCWNELSISQVTGAETLELKRCLKSGKTPFRYCHVSAEHDMIACAFEDDCNLYFYSYEKTKALGFLVVEDFVDMFYVSGKAMLFVITQSKLLCLAYRKFQSSVTFFLKKSVHLWEEILKSHPNLHSTHCVYIEENVEPNTQLLERRVMISSDQSNVSLGLCFNLSTLKPEELKVSYQNYNPFRTSEESHLKSFELGNPSVVIDDYILTAEFRAQYYLQKRGQPVRCLAAFGKYFSICDSSSAAIYEWNGGLAGLLTTTDSLPGVWEIQYYSEKELKELRFVWDFLQNEQKYDQGKAPSRLPEQVQEMKSIAETVTLSSILKSGSFDRAVRSHSLRETKMVLLKERDEREKEENYQEHRQIAKLTELKGASVKINQKYVNESLAFLSVNRNQSLLKKKLNEIELPIVKAFAKKLDAAVNREEKKSITSRLEEKPKFRSTMLASTSKQTTGDFEKILETKLKSESVKDRISRLDQNLKKSKLMHRFKMKGSLPHLRLKID